VRTGDLRQRRRVLRRSRLPGEESGRAPAAVGGRWWILVNVLKEQAVHGRIFKNIQCTAPGSLETFLSRSRAGVLGAHPGRNERVWTEIQARTDRGKPRDQDVDGSRSSSMRRRSPPGDGTSQSRTRTTSFATIRATGPLWCSP